MATEKTPINQWTDETGSVLLVKCLDENGNGTAAAGFPAYHYPTEGKIKPNNCSREPNCESGGFFGWAWGLNIGGGKEPNYRAPWVVLAAPPQQVIDVGNKQKIAADTPDEVDCEVIYYGPWAGAMALTYERRVAWIEYYTADAPATASGYRGAATASGYSGAATASGDSGAATASGDSGAACTSGHLSTINVGRQAIGCVSANHWLWLVRSGAVVACRWFDDETDEPLGHRLLVADELGLTDGRLVEIVNGEVQS